MQKPFVLSGITPALVTSLTKNGKLDLGGVTANTEYLISKGVWGLLVCGSTGEAAALTAEERVKVIQTAVNASKGKVKIIAGSGSPVTSETIRLSQQAKDAGADAVLVLTPYYVIPTQAGLLKHYEAINNAIQMPIIVYNLPQHTLVDIDIFTLEKLADLEFICGLKESSCRTYYVAEALARVGKKISVIEGGDDVTFPSLCMGVAGCIVALGNLAPAELVSIYDNVKAGNFDKARKTYFQILPIARAISVSVNFPAGVKIGVELLGRPAGPVRSPLTITTKEKENIRAALVASRLLS
jgi:4-hydroxy-tetrahydrodipicolinate synthase